MTVRAVNRVCSASFYEAYVHAPASRTWRYYPLQVLLAAIYLSARSAPFAVRWVGGELTLDQVRALLTAPVPARPVCIAAPPDPALRFEVHGAPVDGYRMALHDLSHVVVMSNQPPGRAREAVALHDALAAAIEAAAPPARLGPRLHELLDHALSGYGPPDETIAFIEEHLRDMAPDLGAERTHDLVTRFRDRARSPSFPERPERG